MRGVLGRRLTNYNCLRTQTRGVRPTSGRERRGVLFRPHRGSIEVAQGFEIKRKMKTLKKQLNKSLSLKAETYKQSLKVQLTEVILPFCPGRYSWEFLVGVYRRVLQILNFRPKNVIFSHSFSHLAFNKLCHHYHHYLIDRIEYV